MRDSQEAVRSVRHDGHPAGMDRERRRDFPDEDAAQPAERAPGSVGKAVVVLIVELGRSVRSLWRALPRLLRGLVVWVGAPLAAAVFAVSGAYHLLGAYGVYQFEAVKQAKSRVKKLATERNSLRRELEAANAEAAQARDEADTARKQVAQLTTERDTLRRRGAFAENRGPALNIAAGGTAAQAKAAASTPCTLSGARTELESGLKDCVGEFKRRNGG